MNLLKIGQRLICHYCKVPMDSHSTWPFCAKCNTCFLMNTSSAVQVVYFGWELESGFRPESHLLSNKTILYNAGNLHIPILIVDHIIPDMNPNNYQSICQRLIKNKSLL